MATKFPGFSPSELPMEYFPKTPVPQDSTRGRHYLMPGKIFASKEPHVITAVVGSGICICLYDPKTQIGGANHFLFVNTTAGEANPLKYAKHASESLLNKLVELGANAGSLTARIFGGTRSQLNFSSVESSLGEQNLAAALDFLGSRSIPITTREVGGQKGRKVMFQTDTGIGKCDEL